MPHRTNISIPSDLKRNNRMQILEVLKWGGEYTANQIAGQTGLSRQTVMKAMLFFMERGIVTLAGKAGSTASGGKRPELFALAENRYLLCVDLWRYQVNLTLMNFRCETTGSVQLAVSLPDDVSELPPFVGRETAKLLAAHGVPAERLYAVCVSTSGIVNYADQSLRYSSISPSWGTGLPLAAMLRPCFAGSPLLLLENVGKLTARALLRRQELCSKRVLGVFTSWGLSGCLIERGRIMNGKDSLIGEFGHMILAPDDGERCGCGSRGCFERLVSNAHLRRRAAELLPDYPDSVLRDTPPAELTVQTLFAASARGDACARRLVGESARLFATALRNITLVFDPDVVVIQGDYAAADQHFLDCFHQYLMEFQYYPAGGPFELRLDPRPLPELSAQGAYTILMDAIFQNETAAF